MAPHRKRPPVRLAQLGARIPSTDVEPVIVCAAPDDPDALDNVLLVLLPDGNVVLPGDDRADTPGAIPFRPMPIPQPGINRPGGGGPGGGGPGGGGPGGGGPGGGGPGGGGPGGGGPGGGGPGGGGPGGGGPGGGGKQKQSPRPGAQNRQRESRPKQKQSPRPGAELLPADLSRFSDLLPLIRDVRDIADGVRATVVPCVGNRRHKWGYPNPPTDIDTIASAYVNAGASSPDFTTIATYTAKSSRRALIQSFGYELAGGLLDNSTFRVMRNGQKVEPWTAHTYPPGGLATGSLRACHIELNPGDVLTLEYGYVEGGGTTRVVYGRITGVDFACP